MCADYQIDVRDCQPQLLEALYNMVEQFAVARVYQHPGRAVDEIGIAVIDGHGLPNKGMEVIEYFHNKYPYSFTGSELTVAFLSLSALGGYPAILMRDAPLNS